MIVVRVGVGCGDTAGREAITLFHYARSAARSKASVRVKMPLNLFEDVKRESVYFRTSPLPILS